MIFYQVKARERVRKREDKWIEKIIRQIGRKQRSIDQTNIERKLETEYYCEIIAKH